MTCPVLLKAAAEWSGVAMFGGRRTPSAYGPVPEGWLEIVRALDALRHRMSPRIKFDPDLAITLWVLASPTDGWLVFRDEESGWYGQICAADGDMNPIPPRDLDPIWICDADDPPDHVAGGIIHLVGYSLVALIRAPDTDEETTAWAGQELGALIAEGSIDL